jgi:hypothetical protein
MPIANYFSRRASPCVFGFVIRANVSSFILPGVPVSKYTLGDVTHIFYDSFGQQKSNIITEAANQKGDSSQNVGHKNTLNNKKRNGNH